MEKLRLAMNEPRAESYQPRPTAIYSLEPPYTAEARAAHLQGTVVISFVVGVDGSPKNLAVAKSLGMGLDDIRASDSLDLAVSGTTCEW
jgi:hypothetical protein